MQLQSLTDKFSSDDIEWRIGRAGYTLSGQLYGTVLAYITNRAIMNRLDAVCGPGNWRNEFREWHVGTRHGVLCGISIKINGEWVTKWDGAENTEVEPLKGGLSDAMKRAGVQWGIGRYLYDLEERLAIIDQSGAHLAQGRDRASGKPYRFRWNPPQLPDWALPPTAIRKPDVAKVRPQKRKKAPQERREVREAPSEAASA